MGLLAAGLPLKLPSVRVHTQRDQPEIIHTFADFLQQLLRGFRRLKFGGFIVFSSPASTFSLILKGFNIGQEYC